ncbi:MAG: MFS transporter [Candidatus Wallbacteria bacterium]|nr:MFS transporter [Candidatus Wallbacteria bacterium]
MKGNISKFYMFSFFRMFALFTPVIVLFWQDAGLSMTMIMILQSYFGILLAILEIPTGTLADRYGERKSVMAGSFLVIIACLVYYQSTCFWHFVIAETIWALSAALISGADSALLYNTLECIGEKESFKKIQGNSLALSIIGGGIASLMGGLVGETSLRLTFLLTAIFFVLSYLAVSLMDEPRSRSAEKRASYFSILSETYKFVNKHRLVKWYIAYTACISAFINLFLWFYQPYMQHTGLTIAWFGIAFTIYNLGAALSSKFSQEINSFFGKSMLFVMPVFLILPLFVMPWLLCAGSFLLILFHQFNRGVHRNILNDRILAYTFENKRATVLSLCSLLAVGIRSILGPVLGYLFDVWGFDSFYVFGILFSAVFLFFYLAFRRIPEKYFTVKLYPPAAAGSFE